MISNSSSLYKLFLEAEVICFDFDSTLVKDESILGLARSCGVEQQIKDLFVFSFILLFFIFFFNIFFFLW